MQGEPFGYRGVRQIFALLIGQTCVLLSGSLFVFGTWFRERGLASPPVALLQVALWVFCASLVALVAAFWSTLAGAAFRLVTPRWPRLLGWVLIPSLALVASGIAALYSWQLAGGESGDGPVVFVAAVGAVATVLHAGLAFAIARKMRRLRARDHEWEARAGQVESEHGAGSLARVRLSHALVVGARAGAPRAAPPALVGLTSKPWHDTRDLPWVAALEAEFAAIRAEALEVLRDARRPGRSLSGSGGDAGLREHFYPGVGASGWDSFRFVVAGREIDENCARCPRTAAVLKQLPRHPQFVESMFSVLQPGGVIAPHRDILNVWLTCHLPLVVPPGCGIRVGGIAREWREGEVLLFDASYEHEAWNPSGEPRIVLLTDILHPEITDPEAAFLRWFHWTMIP